MFYGISIKGVFRSAKRHVLFSRLDKQVAALGKSRSFRTNDRTRSAELLTDIDHAIAQHPRDAALLSLMKAEALQTAGFYTEAFDLLIASFERDRSEAEAIAFRIHRLLLAIGAARTGWESVRFSTPDRSVTKAEFLGSILPRLETLSAALPDAPIMTEVMRKRLSLLGNAEALVHFDEANYRRRPTVEASASLIQSSIQAFESSHALPRLQRALELVDQRRRGPYNANYVGAATLAAAIAGQEAWKADILAARKGAPPRTPVEVYRSSPGLIRHHAILAQKKVWTSVYDGDEALKAMVVRDMANAPEARLLRIPKAARDALTRAAMTKEYWEEARRAELVSLIASRTPRRAVTAQQHLTRACWLAHAGQFEEAARSFAAAEQSYGWNASLEIAYSGRRSFLPAALREAPRDQEAASRYGDKAVGVTLLSGPRSQPETMLLACADPKYFARYAEGYLQSVRKTGSMVPVHFHVINPTDDTIARHAALNARFSNVSLSAERLEVEKTTYYACVRFLRAPTFLRMLGCDILLTDIDVTYPRDPAPFLDDPRVQEADAVMRFYDKVRVARSTMRGDLVYRYPRILPWSHVNAACLVLRNTANGVEFADLVRDEMARHLDELMKYPGSGWWADQNALLAVYRTIKRDRPHVRVVNVEDIGMPFGAFASDDDLSRYPPVGYNPAIFG